MNRSLAIVVLLFIGLQGRTQPIPVDESGTSQILSPIGGAFNRIFNSGSLDSFYIKLAALKKTKKGVVRIVHIGDSHIQSGYLAEQVRSRMQQFFGNAGRGLVFPYQVIQTTSPADINSSSNTGWKQYKVANAASSLGAGISGYAIQTNATGASIDLKLDADAASNFKRAKFFISNPSSWLLRASNNETSYFVKNTSEKPLPFTEIELDHLSNGFLLSSLPSTTPQSFFGVSLENDQPGILYHAIGVNGARYEQYNNAPLFWKQLPGLQADLYIISLGTNEAQLKFNDATFRKHVALFLQKLKTASPRAAVIVTTAADSYKGGRPNTDLRLLNLSLFEYCTAKNIPTWDLYRVTNGFGSAHNWKNRGYMNEDLVHFTGEGYRLQGLLLFNAIAKGFNDSGY